VGEYLSEKKKGDRNAPFYQSKDSEPERWGTTRRSRGLVILEKEKPDGSSLNVTVWVKEDV